MSEETPTTVEFTFEINCGHTDEAMGDMADLIMGLLTNAGLEVQSNVEIPVGKEEGEEN